MCDNVDNDGGKPSREKSLTFKKLRIVGMCSLVVVSCYTRRRWKTVETFTRRNHHHHHHHHQPHNTTGAARDNGKSSHAFPANVRPTIIRDATGKT